MKRTVAVVVVLVAVLFALWSWRKPERSSSKRAGAGGATSAAGAAGGAGDRLAVEDPRKLARGSIRGVVRAKGGGPIAGAQVCTTWSGDGVVSEDSRDPVCALTDASGAYALTKLVPAWHDLGASAPEHIPRRWRDPTTGEDDAVKLAPGEQRTGVDFTLPPGGVKISGVVEDVSGGPVAAALVALSATRWGFGATTATTRTDDHGRFTLWSKPGDAHVTAIAEGYADGGTDASAPTALVHLYLTPESSLSGTVVSAGDQRPIAGATVEVGAGGWMDDTTSGTARSDAAGRFRFTRLSPGRYKPTASGDGLYGEPAESVLLGLGQSVDGVVIAVAAASTVRGKVVIDAGGTTAPCPEGSVSISDKRTDRHDGDALDPDGTFALTHVLPGHYEIDVTCDDHMSAERYPPIDVVAGQDVVDLVWTVTAGATITGTVKTAAGQPVAEATVSARGSTGSLRAQMALGHDTTRDDGTFRVTGLGPGEYTFFVRADGQRSPSPPPKLTVAAGAQATIDIVFPGGGAIAGTVVDTAGKPVPGAEVFTTGGGAWSWGGGVTSDDGGAFRIENVEPGVRRVIASRGGSSALRKPGTTDDDKQGEQVKVVAGQTAAARLVVDVQDGTITGLVQDGKGEPVVDAWIVATRESDAAGAAAGQAMRSSRWSWGNTDRPIITGTDGRFTVGGLSRGTYTLRAYRRGGGEAVAEHVALGANATLTIPSTGSFAGAVVLAGGGAPEQVELSLRDAKTGFAREETFFRTGGKFVLRDLPGGDFVVTAEASGGHAETTLALAPGEDKTGVTIALEAKLTVKGRFVDLETAAPVAGMRASVTSTRGAGGRIDFGQSSGDQANLSGADGRFVVTDAPSGLVSISGFPVDMMSGGGTYSYAGWVAELTGGPEVDVGDIPVPKSRIKPGDQRGQLGMSFVRAVPGTDLRQRVLAVAHVAADGPAARAGIQVGDVIVTIDGFDVKGVRAVLAGTLLSVKAGTVLRLGLQRGVEVALTAAADE